MRERGEGNARGTRVGRELIPFGDNRRFAGGEDMPTIHDLFSIFRNPYEQKRWQVWDGVNLIGLFYTRREARTCRREWINQQGRQGDVT